MNISAFVIGTYGLLMSYLMIWQAKYDWHTNPTTPKLAILYAVHHKSAFPERKLMAIIPDDVRWIDNSELGVTLTGLGVCVVTVSKLIATIWDLCPSLSLKVLPTPPGIEIGSILALFL